MRKAKGFRRSPCPIASLLDVVGDKWSLLLVRDMLLGKRTYGELLDSPERIPTNILADRLRRLEDAGLIASSPYQERPVRYAYTLTEKGEALDEVLEAVVGWGKKHIPGTRTLKEPASASAARKRIRLSARTRAKAGAVRSRK
jgi:DNA-binding HxlR family transcriptional regulator